MSGKHRAKNERGAPGPGLVLAWGSPALNSSFHRNIWRAQSRPSRTPSSGAQLKYATGAPVILEKGL